MLVRCDDRLPSHTNQTWTVFVIVLVGCWRDGMNQMLISLPDKISRMITVPKVRRGGEENIVRYAAPPPPDDEEEELDLDLEENQPMIEVSSKLDNFNLLKKCISSPGYLSA